MYIFWIRLNVIVLFEYKQLVNSRNKLRFCINSIYDSISLILWDNMFKKTSVKLKVYKVAELYEY